MVITKHQSVVSAGFSGHYINVEMDLEVELCILRK